jgi:signal transduction histidine kinase
LLLAAGVAAVMSALLGLFLAGRLVRPLSRLTEAAGRLGEGNYEYPLSVHGQDEIGSLSSAFESMRQRLQRIEKTRAQFISDVSHELRTPLTGIKGLVETLQDGALEDPAARRRFIGSIGHETERLIRLTQDLLTLTRADEHALEMHLERHDLGELVAGTVDRMRPEAEKRGLRLDSSRTAAKLPVLVDPDRFEQILLNLVDNALKNSAPGAVIRIEVEEIRPDAVPSPPSLHAAKAITDPTGPASRRWAVVRVLDRGRGIPAEARERIFDRFFRADPARDRHAGGSGLGLPIAMALVHEHGGRIWIDSPSPDWNGEGPPGTQACFALPLV